MSEIKTLKLGDKFRFGKWVLEVKKIPSGKLRLIILNDADNEGVSLPDDSNGWISHISYLGVVSAIYSNGSRRITGAVINFPDHPKLAKGVK